jgi:hypothetical protein
MVMSAVTNAQRAFERLAADKRTELLSRLCLTLTVRTREALGHDEADVESARAFNEVLLAALSAMPSLLVGSSNPHHGEGSSDDARLAALFERADQSGIGHSFESAWDAAVAHTRSSALGPGANSNDEDLPLASITERAKARIEAVLAAYPARDRKRAVPIICWAGEPAMGGFYEERAEIEDQIVTISGLDIVLALLDDDAPQFQGKVLDFNGTAFVLI